ncbi:MAG: DnaJ domain-containing protein [Mesorhizobium sp.]|nr:DnaJ C-terminal domain-containing protein [Mesorhizobium sp.]MCO5160074.1 DnaJ domain-containing protein [Mesorhizobium sp.]
MRNPYDVLGVAKTASSKEIKAAFRKAAKQHHPDQNPNDPKAKDRFAAVNQAYEILGDEKRRGEFDRGEIDAEGKPRFAGFEGAGAGGDPFAGFRRSGQGPGGARFEFRTAGGPGGGAGFGAGDIFGDLFGSAFGRGEPEFATRGAPSSDMKVNLDISIEEAATGIRKATLFPDGRKVGVQLPHYVEDGQEIRLKGEGALLPTGGRGDAVVKIRLRRHPRYTLDGRDLRVDLPVSLKDAVLGAKLPVETLGGRVAVTVPPWSSSDRVLRIKGRGLPTKTGDKADLYVHVRVMLPEGGDHELEALMKKRGA